MINKELIKFRFNKSVKTYNETAIIQKEMAKKLTDKTISFCGSSFDKVFEFGAGTGFLSQNIVNQIKFNEYYANDIIEESEYCIKNIINTAKFLSGDIEKINITEKFDLVVSNAVVQWVSDLDELLLKIRSNLSDNGYFAFTTFGEQNYHEIRETTGVSLDYLKTETLKEKCNAKFEIISFEESIQTLFFDTPLEVLKHIKNSGTNSIKSTNWTMSKLKVFNDFYRKSFSSGNKVILTYHPIFVILKAK